MPELPEVETLCRQLKTEIVGKEILKSIVYDNKLGKIVNLKGRRINSIERRGKNILLLAHDGQGIIIHLRMTGRLLYRRDKKTEPHTRWRIVFKDCNIDLVDPRRFATVRIEKTHGKQEAKDLITGFDKRKFLAEQARRRVSVKTLLMDGKALQGIGNIYACEILHAARISPEKISEKISREEWNKVFAEARRILKRGIQKRGTTVSDWRDLYGCSGENQFELKVYGKEGERCCFCHSIIQRRKQGGRSTYYCPECQKLDE